MTATHEVLNQVPPLEGHDTAADPALLEGLRREGAGWAEDEIHELGRLAGSAEAQDWARLAERYPPRLNTHDRYGNRVDEIEYVPAYHELMRTAVTYGLHAAPWAAWQAASRRRSGAGSRSGTRRGWPPTTATGTGSTRSSTSRRTTT